MEIAIAAESEDGRRRVEAAYGRIAEAETRRQEQAAREAAPAPSPAPEPQTQPAPAGSQAEEFSPPPAAVGRGFVRDGRQLAAWQQSGSTRGRYAPWRRTYFNERMK